MVSLTGVCDGDSTSCTGCDRIPNSGKVFDACGVCGGNGSSCVNITHVIPSSLPESGGEVLVVGAGLDGQITCLVDGTGIQGIPKSFMSEKVEN